MCAAHKCLFTQGVTPGNNIIKKTLILDFREPPPLRMQNHSNWPFIYRVMYCTCIILETPVIFQTFSKTMVRAVVP